MVSRLQVLWDYFIQAESQSYEKSVWLDVFLGELLCQVKEGQDVKEALNTFCSAGGSGVSTLVSCELLSDVHELCGKEADNCELRNLRKYLIEKRGWRCLAALHVLGARGISCARELVALLVALYPVVTQEDHHHNATGDGNQDFSRNPYIRFQDKSEEDVADAVNVLDLIRRKNAKLNGISGGGGGSGNNGFSLNNGFGKSDGRSQSNKKSKKYNKKRCDGEADETAVARRDDKGSSSKWSKEEGKRNNNKALNYLATMESSDSELVTDTVCSANVDQARSLTLKIRLNPMDFEYFTSVVRSDDEEEKSRRAAAAKHQHRHAGEAGNNWGNNKRRNHPEDLMDERIRAVFNCKISNFDLSLLIIEVLQGMKEYETPSEQTPAVQVLKFALDTLWSLQFGGGGTVVAATNRDGQTLTRKQAVTLKAAASKLMLLAMERILRTDEPTTAVINNGLLPMTLRLLEDATADSPVDHLSQDEASLVQEFVFATCYGVITFLYCLLHQGNTPERLRDFLELFQLFSQSQGGKLIEQTIFTIVNLPSGDHERTMRRARKVFEMISALMGALKRRRQEARSPRKPTTTTRPPHRKHHHHNQHGKAVTHGSQHAIVSSYHHLDAFGLSVAGDLPSARASEATQMCCVSSLFASLMALLKQSRAFPRELRRRILKIISTSGTCCCYSANDLFPIVVGFLKNLSNEVDADGNDEGETYATAVTLVERTLYKELGAYASSDLCDTCAKFNDEQWDFLELYCELLSPDNPKLAYLVMAHLLRVTSNCKFSVKHELLFKVFHPIFVKSKDRYLADKSNQTAIFLVHSCLSIITSTIVNVSLYERYVESYGFDDTLELLDDPTFTKVIYSLLEISVTMEIWKSTNRRRGSADVPDIYDRSVTQILINILVAETDKLLAAIEQVDIECATDRSIKESSERSNDDDDSCGSPISAISEDSHNYHSLNDSSSFVESSAAATPQEPEETSATYKSLDLFQASYAWRAAAGVTLRSPKFREELIAHPVANMSVRLLKAISVQLATDTIKDTNKSAHRLIEALITCWLTDPVCGYDIVTELGKVIMDMGIKLGHGIAVLIEALLRMSMLRASQEQTIPQQTRPRLPTMALETWVDGHESSVGEYITADDGYEADVEVPGNTPRREFFTRQNSLGPFILPEPKSHVNAHPALCSLAIDLLIHFLQQGLDNERSAIVTSGLRRVAVTCRESALSCAALAGTGAITKILDGFKDIFITRDPQYQDLQHAALQVFTLLATQSITSVELVCYLQLFKVDAPPLLSLLEPLYRLVLHARPQPNFILAFPVATSADCTDNNNFSQSSSRSSSRNDERKSTEKAEDLVKNFNSKHLAAGICSPWSVHAVCLPVAPELSWPLWLHGCSAAMWLRVERGSPLSSRTTLPHSSSLRDSDSESLSDWGILSDNWNREVNAGSSSPPTPATIIHLLSMGTENLVLELWIDLRLDKLILRLTRPDEKSNRTISETCISGMLSSSRWHHMALNVKDMILNKRSAVIEVTIWIDGWREVKAQLPFDGLLVRKASTTCLLLGQVGPTNGGAWYFGNLMLFRYPVFTREKALYLAALGPNYTNLAECLLNNAKADFAPLILSGALNGVKELKFEGGKFDLSRRKSYGGTFLRHPVEAQVSESKIDWDSVMDSGNSHLTELQDNFLLNYEAQNPNVVHLYPQAVTNHGAVVRNLFPGQSGFRVVSAPEHRISQQPPLSVPPISNIRMESQQYRGLVPAASLLGGIPIFLYLFARVVELESTEEEQALAVSIVLRLARSDSELLNQYRSEGGASLLLRVFESPRCYTGKHILKAVLDAACDSAVIIKDIASGNHSTSQNCEAVIIDPELIKSALTAWRTWAKYDTLNLLIQALLLLLRDQHLHREFNAAQLNRVGIVDSILLVCKEHFLYEDVSVCIDPTTGNAIVELLRALMGAPPEFVHLVAITDYLILVHQASETYVTHSRHNMYFSLPTLEERKSTSRVSSVIAGSSSDESISAFENSKLTKALRNVQIQRGRSIKNKERHSDTSKETSGGEDSGIAASDGSNNHIHEKRTLCTDERRACQGLVCEGLLLLLRDALRVLPDNQVCSVLKHVLRAEVLLVLANDPDARVRTAIVKVMQTYLQRANDEEINKFIKNKYFMHLANQLSLYPCSEPLALALESLALRGPTLAAVPPLLSMIWRASMTEPNVARPMLACVIDIVTKTPNALKTLIEQGLMESLARSLASAAHLQSSSSSIFFRDVHVLLVAMATKLLESPGSNQMQALADMHLVLNHVELKERSACGASEICVGVLRDAQVALLDGELDALASKVSNNCGFRLRSATSYLASASYLTSALTTSSEQSQQSDHGSRSSSYGSLQTYYHSSTREPGKGEINDRFRAVLVRAVEFVTTADDSTLASSNELQLSKRIFSILLHGLSNPFERKHSWGGVWSSRATLRKYTARIMVWLLAPQQSISTRIYAVRSLLEEPKAREILAFLLDVHPQVEQKFTVFLWDLLHRREEMPSADARACAELREALNVWDLAKSIEYGNPGLWVEELELLNRELMRDRDIWIDSNLSAINRIGNKFDGQAKQLSESAMTITCVVVEEQNRERKTLMETLKHSRGVEAQAVARWKDLARRLTHERAPWHFPQSYPTSWELDPTEGPARVRIRMQRCHLNIDKRFFMPEHQQKIDTTKVESPLSYLFVNDRQNTNASALIERLHTTERIRKMSQARVVIPRAELAGEALIGETCLYFVPDNPDFPLNSDIALGGLDLAMVGGTAWRLEDIRELHRRRYQLQERAIEIFLVTGRTYLLAFNTSKDRDTFATELACNLPRRVPGDDLGEALALWRSGALTNWEYVTCLNKLAGRSYNDLMQYPVFPFVLSDYLSDKLDLNNPNIYRNFKRPMAVQDKKNEQHYINNYNYLKQALAEGLNLIALNQEPFHYGSHYSNSGTVLHFLVRLPPFTSMFLNYQDDNFDIPDRTFHALATTWRLTSCDSTTDVKELIPEFFYLPEFLLNFEGFNFGIRQNGCRVDNVELPAWCGGDARLFVLVHRAALEADLVREVLPYWIDLVFGFRQTGRPAVEAINVFHPATYYGFNVEQIADPLERQAWETMVRTYGQTPAQLFRVAHPLPAQNLAIVAPSASLPQVIDGVTGIKWGNYVGAPGNEPVLCWKNKHRAPLATLVPLTTGDVFGLPSCTTLLLGYSKEKGSTSLSGTSVLGAALASWGGSDGIARLKYKKEQPPKPLIKSSGLDPITILESSPDCSQLWAGHLSGRITVYSYSIGVAGRIEFNVLPASVLLAHSSAVTVISLSRAFSIAVSGDSTGLAVIWDLNGLFYVRSIEHQDKHPIRLISISETLGDIAICYKTQWNANDETPGHSSELKVYTINGRSVGCVLSRRTITALCYSNAPEGASVNVIATGLNNGVIRLWSSWDMRLVREIVNGSKGCGAIIALAWALDQHHLYAATEDSTVLIWEGSRRLSNGTPKFVNLTSL